MEQAKKRLFFGMEVLAPWPDHLPSGRILDEQHRHITVAFLGETDWSSLSQAIKNIPLPPFKVGLTGYFDQCQFLPKWHSNVAAWHVKWLDDPLQMIDYQKQLTQWLIQTGFPPSQPNREWLPHVTLCRKPFNARLWNDTFVKLPMFCKNLNLYESVGNLKYEPIWSHPILPPFQEIDHTADVAFLIYGESLPQILHHAQTAMAFAYPPFLNHFSNEENLNSLDDIIISLNHVISKADQSGSCPYKAVSFHGDLILREDKVYQWEMIVDV